MTAPNCILYHRVSTLEQDPTLARAELERAATQRGLTVLECVEETGSGARNDRPGLARVLTLAAKTGAAVVVWKLDRFGRSVLDVLSNVRELRACGSRFICTTQGIDIGAAADPMANFMLNILAAVAEFERDLIKERTAAGLARAKSRGHRPGPVPPPTRAADAASVRHLRAQGRSWSQVARALNLTPTTARRLATMGPPISELDSDGKAGAP